MSVFAEYSAQSDALDDGPQTMPTEAEAGCCQGGCGVGSMGVNFNKAELMDGFRSTMLEIGKKVLKSMSKKRKRSAQTGAGGKKAKRKLKKKGQFGGGRGTRKPSATKKGQIGGGKRRKNNKKAKK
jgi:hypothetical protein